MNPLKARMANVCQDVLRSMLLEQACDNCLIGATPQVSRAIDAALRAGATVQQVRRAALRAGATPQSLTLLAVEAQIARTCRELGYPVLSIDDELVDLGQPLKPPATP